MPGGFPYALTEAHRTPAEPRKAAGVRDTTRHANAAQRAAEGAQSHARKTTERPTRSSTAARMGLFSFTFRFVSAGVSRGELYRANFRPSEKSFLRLFGK